MKKLRTERDEEVRDSDLRPEYNFEYVNPYDLPPGVYREGYRYHWGRHNIRGASDNQIERLRRKKWELVEASRTTAKYIDPLGENPLSEKFIYVNGCLLMERHEKYSEYEDQQHHRNTIEQTKALEVQISDEGHLYNSQSKRY